ncbi:putative ribose/galactose/methyl galactoside import ATP-binding protein 3 [Catellatospora methionotrophica]|uniref:Putative ribose/galactose/methyl galactoside import ATP-binding protein 3 n=1 Tax=Catellatospora methionotrophica TaxID=121620 RepID=A0A8J3PFI0_9ACTN|nr:sugar ABC transporter ATP-binding protein [Catellatospora methionotrophica]GIG15257.1 putative ribose/galactose/methyl galactoside import ATP-binding protein 3 [Catellatospora methionotrophica]
MQPDSDQPLLRMRGVGKAFFGVRVLDDVDLDLHPGQVHALVGENGAGKSTLMKIASGVYQPDAGTLELSGKPVTLPDPRAAQAAGIGIIHQEFNLLPERTVAENVFLGREPLRRGLVDRRAMQARTAELLAGIGESAIAPQAKVGRLSVAQQQVVEIVKALALDARVLIMDEPTASLADHEVELLYALVRRLQARGIGILYVSHRLTEVFDLSGRITVLKDGRRVTTLATAEATADTLVRHMVGRELSHYYPDRAAPGSAGAAVLTLSAAGNGRLRPVDLELRSGEVLGVGGLQGSGRSALARAVFGIDGFRTGQLLLDGVAMRVRSPRQAVRAGIAYVTEDRKGEGLALSQSVLDNALLAQRAVTPRWFARNARATTVRELLDAVEVHAAGTEQEIRYLSGGNQQKVILARWLAMKPRVLLFDEPTRGIDVGAKAAIHDLIRRLAADGAAVLMISSELPELIGMSDRIVVMRDGAIAGELPAGSSEEAVMGLATGAATNTEVTA